MTFERNVPAHTTITGTSDTKLRKVMDAWNALAATATKSGQETEQQHTVLIVVLSVKTQTMQLTAAPDVLTFFSPPTEQQLEQLIMRAQWKRNAHQPSLQAFVLDL